MFVSPSQLAACEMPRGTAPADPAPLHEGDQLTQLRERQHPAKQHRRPTLSAEDDDARTRQSHAIHRARLERALGRARE